MGSSKSIESFQTLFDSEVFKELFEEISSSDNIPAQLTWCKDLIYRHKDFLIENSYMLLQVTFTENQEIAELFQQCVDKYQNNTLALLLKVEDRDYLFNYTIWTPLIQSCCYSVNNRSIIWDNIIKLWHDDTMVFPPGKKDSLWNLRKSFWVVLQGLSLLEIVGIFLWKNMFIYIMSLFIPYYNSLCHQQS